MTLYGIGLGPGDPELLTVRGRRLLESAAEVYCPGRLSESLAARYVPDTRLTRLEFPMTDDRSVLEDAWADAAATVGPRAADEDVAFVTIGDPNVYSTFGHLRRTLEDSYPGVDVEVVPGVSMLTAFATALGVEIDSGAPFGVREATGGDAPTGPDRLLLLKVTDVPATHDGLVSAGYEVIYGRRLFMDDGERVVTRDPADLESDDYYTIAYAERPGSGSGPAGTSIHDGDTIHD